MKLDVVGFHITADGHELRPMLLIRGVSFNPHEVDFTTPQRQNDGRVSGDGDGFRRAQELILIMAFFAAWASSWVRPYAMT